MNRALPPRDRGNRVADSFGPTRPSRVVPSVIRLVGGASHSRRPATAREMSPAARPLGAI